MHLQIDDMHVVPSTASIIEYVLKMATGDPSVPKGGDPKYRSGEWYKTCFGKNQGECMTEENAKEYGHGAHADEPYRFITIERKLSALRQWYDEVLKETKIANPARNKRLSKVMATLEKMMGRGRKHTTPMLREAILKAVHTELKLADPDEVCVQTCGTVLCAVCRTRARSGRVRGVCDGSVCAAHSV